jgi:hypothetical protein
LDLHITKATMLLWQLVVVMRPGSMVDLQQPDAGST